MSCSEAPWHGTLMKCEGTRLCWRFSWNIASAGKKQMTTTAKYTCEARWNCHILHYDDGPVHVTDSCQVMQYKQLLCEICNNPEMFGSQFQNAQISIFWEMHKSANCFTTKSALVTEKLKNWNVYIELIQYI